MKPDHMRNQFMLKILLPLFVMLSLVLQSTSLLAAPKKDLDPDWDHFSVEQKISVDHQAWQVFLDTYLHTDTTQQTFLAYGNVNKEGKENLDRYLSYLTELNPPSLTKEQQMPYWINLYNAKTVQLILDHYPTKSITKLGKRWLGFGPWDDKILTINDRELSLNDVEHRILRPIYNDPRIHYVVNCASFSCPNLAAQAFTLDNTQLLLEQSAKDYINHSRGVMLKDSGSKLMLSSIYDWYLVDFGNNDTELLDHLKQYANPELAAQLNTFSGSISYDYDWSLNEHE